MTTFEVRLREQATKSLDVTEAIITTGAEAPQQQVRTALALITGELKQQANRTRQMAQMISLTRFAVRDAATRERIALGILGPLLPAGTLPAASSDMIATQGLALASLVVNRCDYGR